MKVLHLFHADVGDGINERNGVVDEGRKSSGEVVRWDMGSGKGGNGGRCCGVSQEDGMEVCVIGRDDGCLLSGVKLYSLSSSLGW